MPGGISLLKYLKKTPNTDDRNLIEPTADVRYLAMKLRSGQTKNIIDLLETDDTVLVTVDEDGRYIAIKSATDTGTIIVLKQGDGKAIIEDGVAEFGGSVKYISFHFPYGTWTFTSQPSLGPNFLSIYGCGTYTSFEFNPTISTSNALVAFQKSFSLLDGITFSCNSNCQNGYLIDFNGKDNIEIRNCFIAGGDDGNNYGCIDITNSQFCTIFNNNIRTYHIGIYNVHTVCPAFFNQVIQNWFNGINGGSSIGIRIGGDCGLPFHVKMNHFVQINKGILVDTGKSILNSIISDNHFQATTLDIDHTNVGGDSYLIHGNVFVGGGTNIPAGVKQRDNIGLADAN